MLLKKDINRTLIENIVNLNLKNYSSDSKRSLRRLIDSGRRLTRSAVQSQILSTVGSLFEKEDSPYYPAIDKLFTNVEHRILTNFGINLGLVSWSRGTKKLHAAEKISHRNISWLHEFHVEQPEEFTLDNLQVLVTDNNNLGVFAFTFVMDELDEKVFKNILQTAKDFPYSNFMVFIPDVVLSDELLDLAESLNNFATGLLLEGTHREEMELKLSTRHMLYSLIVDISDTDDDSFKTNLQASINQVANAKSPLLSVRSDKVTDEITINQMMQKANDARMAMKEPVLLAFYNYDAQKINRIISGTNVPIAD